MLQYIKKNIYITFYNNCLYTQIIMKLKCKTEKKKCRLWDYFKLENIYIFVHMINNMKVGLPW
jgi:hypothetical protein